MLVFGSSSPVAANMARPRGGLVSAAPDKLRRAWHASSDSVGSGSDSKSPTVSNCVVRPKSHPLPDRAGFRLLWPTGESAVENWGWGHQRPGRSEGTLAAPSSWSVTSRQTMLCLAKSCM